VVTIQKRKDSRSVLISGLRDTVVICNRAADSVDLDYSRLSGEMTSAVMHRGTNVYICRATLLLFCPLIVIQCRRDRQTIAVKTVAVEQKIR
jgi:hypothetical protein